MDLYEMNARTISDLVRRKECSAVEVVNSVLKRIESVEERVHAYITVLAEEAIDQASRIDKKIARGVHLGPLGGVPVALKDNLCVRNLRTTCASRMLAEFLPPYDATIVRRLREADAILIGKTNMDEFAQGSSTETSFFGPTRNPWDLTRVPGGTSGGSVAALSADETISAVGSDTGGSIRQPASFCGVVGLKPTYGRVSRYGLVAYASSLDTVAPAGKDVKDCALLLNIIAGKDPLDATSVDLPVPNYLEGMRDLSLQGIHIGVPREFLAEGNQEDVQRSIEEAIRVLERLGAEIGSVSLDLTDYGIAAYYLIATSEVSSNLARYSGVHYGHRCYNPADLLRLYCTSRSEGFGPEVKRRILLGTYALSAGYYDEYYLKAQRVRHMIIDDYLRALDRYDVLVGPASPFPAFRLGEKIDNPLEMYLADVYTVTVNMAGLPAICVPCGITRDGLPIGIQMIGRHFEEGLILRVANAFEAHRSPIKFKPPL